MKKVTGTPANRAAAPAMRLSSGPIERVDHAKKSAQEDDMPVGYETRECKGGKGQRLCYRQPLRYYEDISQVPPVEPHSREKRKAEHRELADEIHKTKREARELSCRQASSERCAVSTAR